MRFIISQFHIEYKNFCVCVLCMYVFLSFTCYIFCSLSRQYNLVSLYPHFIMFCYTLSAIIFFFNFFFFFNSFQSDYHTSGKQAESQFLKRQTSNIYIHIYFLYNIICGTFFHKSKYGVLNLIILYKIYIITKTKLNFRITKDI